MHDLAISLAEQGHRVSGSDDRVVEPSRSRLKRAGLLPEREGWFPEKITEEIDAVILGMHAKADNPELRMAQTLGLNIHSFPAFVHEQSMQKTRVVIAGTHGKTTIMSMVMHVLRKLGRDFDYLVGAQLAGFDSLIKLTPHNKIILLEGDEHYASAIDRRSKFHVYSPNIALISCVEWNEGRDKTDRAEYQHRFETLVDGIAEKGTLIYNKDCPVLREVVDGTLDCKINRHGYSLPEHSVNKGQAYLHLGPERIPLQVFGKTNLSNIAGAHTVCEWLGVKRADFYRAIQDFRNTVRQLEFVAGDSESVVYQDFDTSADRLRTSIHAIKEQFPEQPLATVVELSPRDLAAPDFLAQYAGAMDESDYAVVLADQDAIRDSTVRPEDLERETKRAFNHQNLVFISDTTSLESYLKGFKGFAVNLLFMVPPDQKSISTYLIDSCPLSID